MALFSMVSVFFSNKVHCVKCPEFDRIAFGLKNICFPSSEVQRKMTDSIQDNLKKRKLGEIEKI